MRVVTLSESELVNECGKLADLVGDAASYSLIIGIETGGAVVAEKVFRFLRGSSASELKYATVACRRPGTKRKSHFRKCISLLPYWISDIIRKLESTLSECYFRRSNVATSCRRNVVLSRKLIGMAAQPEKILLIDDAVDTGETLFCVKERMRELFAQSDIVTACLVVTQGEPLIRPDFVLYNRVLIRFPWSVDFHG